MRARTYVCATLVACALFAASNRATAQVNTWTNSGSGSWGTAGNWDGGLPSGTDDISITGAGAYTVTVDDNTADNDLGLAVNSVIVGTGSGRPELTIGFTNTTKVLTVGTGTAGTLKIGTTSGTHGRLSVADGEISAAHLLLGEGGSASTGEARISGGTVTLRSNATGLNWIRLGNTASSTGMVVMTGGTLNGPGYGGTYGNIGGAGKGLLIISNGLFTAGGYGLYIGAASGADGEVRLPGGELKLTKGLIEVGSGYNSRGSILIDGGRLTVTNGAGIAVAERYGSRGSLTVSNGTLHMVDGVLSVGSRAGAYGVVDIAGGTNYVGKSPYGLTMGAYAGGGGTGVLNVTAGRLTVHNGWAYPGGGSGGVGIINVSGGEFDNQGYGLIMGDANGAWSEINVTGGKCDVNVTYLRSGAITVDGGVFAGGTTYIGTTGGYGPTLKTGSVTVVSGTLTLGSTTVGAADRPGYLTIEGSTSTNTLASLTASPTNSTLTFILDETGISPITVTGALNVSDDTKLVVNIDNYDAPKGDSFVLIDYGSIGAGRIAEENITINGGSGGRIDQTTDNKVTLNISPPPGTTILIR